MAKPKDEIRIHGLASKKELNQDLFNTDRMKDNVRDACMYIAEKFNSYLDVPLEMKDVTIVGSSINYNWNKTSDIDIHLVMDLSTYPDCTDIEVVRELMLSKVHLFNTRHDINLFGQQVELYVNDINDVMESSAIYSIKSNVWIRKPKYVSPDVNRDKIVDKVFYYMNLIDKLEQIPNAQERYDMAIKVKDKIVHLRRSTLLKDGEYAWGNLVFKTLRSYKYTQKLYEILNEAFDEKLSVAPE
jgi:predicted nucleotidyltransferase